MSKTLTLGSLFDGSGGFPLGGMLAGITPVWASEIEPFPIRVTTRRLPFMKHYGDISKMDGGKIEPVDIITFGSPCTDMSVAGKRAGLDGRQSVLFYQAVRIIKEMRQATNGVYPRYIVWENVPGAFSSNGGEDFRAVLEAVIGIVEPDVPSLPAPEKGRWPYADCIVGDGWSLAYRTLDAQYWGVAQRRRRIYLVADFAGGSAGKILFESEGLSGYSAESFRAWQRAAGSSAEGIGETGGNGADGIVLNDQGGSYMVIDNDRAGTLRAEAHGHSPCIMEAAGFSTEHSAKSRSIGYEEECSPTLRAGVVPAAVALENHPTDGRIKIEENNTVQPLTSRMGTGGMNVPLLLKIRSGCEGGGKGPLIQEDKSATLSCNNDQTLFAPCAWDGGQTSPTLTAHNANGSQRMPDKDHFNCVLQPFGISSKDSNAMKSANPKSGIYEAKTARTLDKGGGNPTCNQGGIAVVCEEKDSHPAVCIQGSMIGRAEKNGPQGDGINEEVSFTLNTIDRHAVYALTTGGFSHVSEGKAPTLQSRDYKAAAVVSEPAYGIGRDAFNQGQNAKYSPSIEEEVQPTLVAKGPGAVAETVTSDDPVYTVRRLTPTECARLQGFPDWWCDGLGTPAPDYEELQHWFEVFETYRKITSPETKPRSLKQIEKWLRDPHSDAAEYKMWGNGVCLNIVVMVMCGIRWAAGLDSQEKT